MYHKHHHYSDCELLKVGRHGHNVKVLLHYSSKVRDLGLIIIVLCHY